MNSEAYQRGFIKAAMANGMNPLHAIQLFKEAQSIQVQNQDYMPIGGRRELTPSENSEVDQAQSRMFPTIFPSLASPISSKMYSPMTAGLAGGGIGALLGGGLGAGIGNALNKG